jgi:hydroxymethylbilane synthase
MAVAALDVLGLLDQITDYLPPESFVPSPGQGCVAVECRDDDRDVIDALTAIDHAPTRRVVSVERAFLASSVAAARCPSAHMPPSTS